ncbi:hypothetical protein Tco_0252014 [Tanacetum coccineum]
MNQSCNIEGVDDEKEMSGIKVPSDAMHNPSQPFGVLSTKLVSVVTEIYTISIDISFRDQPTRIKFLNLNRTHSIFKHLLDIIKFKAVNKGMFPTQYHCDIARNPMKHMYHNEDEILLSQIKQALAAQLVPQYKQIKRCNNYAVLQSIPCSPECKIVELILLDHCLSHALTETADVHVVYLQQFWRTMSKVPDTEDTIKFMLNTQQFTYTVDMFRDTLHLPVETPENPFVAPANIHTTEAFMNRVGYQGVVDKFSAFYTKNLAQPWQTVRN